MPTSTMRPSGGLSVADSCGGNLLPDPPSCQAAFLPSFVDDDEEQEVEVELTCSWSHEYPVQNMKFKHGFDNIEPQLELSKEMIFITRKIFRVTEQDLSVVGFVCEFSFLHPLCGPIDEQSPCSITRAEIRSDPLIEEVELDGSAQVFCHTRDNNNAVQEQANITWETKRITQNKFVTLTNGSRRSVSEDGTVATLSGVRAGDNLTLVRCDVEGNATTKNFGLTQIRVVEATTPVPTPSLPTTRLPTTSTTISPSTSVLQTKTDRMIITSTPRSDKTTLLIPNPTTKMLLFENIYFIISIVLVPVVIFFGICIIIMMVRHRRNKKVSADPRRVPAANHEVNDNMYEYVDSDNALEHEYFQSYQCAADDTASQHSEYVNDRMVHGGKSGRTTRLLRSRSDSRLAQMPEAFPLKELPKSQSAWALPGLSTELSVLDRPMPQLPFRKRSMTANAVLRPPLPRGDPPHRYSEPGEYAMIDDSMLSRSLDISGTKHYACTQLNIKSQTMDPKLFIPKRMQKK